MRPYYAGHGLVIYHGDMRVVLSRLGFLADLLIADPPYGVEWIGRRRSSFGPIVGDDGSLDVRDAMRIACQRLKDHRHVYCFGPDIFDGLPIIGRAELIWDKGIMGLGDLALPWGPAHERITFGVNTQHFGSEEKIDPVAARLRRGSVIRVPRVNGVVSRHPTEKPVLLYRQLIESSSMLGDLILDPFMGVGPCLIAALHEGRRAIGIEIEERYCKIAAEWIEQEARHALA